ncbi:MAG: peptidase U32 family protein [Candidatus Omnitrophota bacterium]
MTKFKKPELVAPAGDWASLYSAAEAGADAVYFGVKGMNMRYGARNFDALEMKKIAEYLHGEGKKSYLALNVLVYNDELDKVKTILEKASKAGIDAVILWDMAVLSAAKELGIKAHLSTQASVSNLEALKVYCRLGVERLVLARECGLSDIRKIILGIRGEKLKCGIEVFIHGAMCLSVSGRCLLSQYSFNKSANRGECIQPCRRQFVITDKDKECEYLLAEDYILSTKDLCTVGFIDKLIEAGINAFKIEGRMRPPEYVSRVTSVYRKAIDAFFEKKLDSKLKKELFKQLGFTFNRGFTDGFYFKQPLDLGEPPAKKYEKIYLGEIKKFYKKLAVAEVLMSAGKLESGQMILITGKKTAACFSRIKEIEIDHKPVRVINKGETAGIKLDFEVKPKDKVFLWKEL